MERYYVDRFRGGIVTKKDPYAAPERYYEYVKGLDGIVKETYIANYEPLMLIDFAYVVDDISNLDFIYEQRNNFLKQHGVSVRAPLYAYAVPPEWFEKAIAELKEE